MLRCEEDHVFRIADEAAMHLQAILSPIGPAPVESDIKAFADAMVRYGHAQRTPGQTGKRIFARSCCSAWIRKNVPADSRCDGRPLRPLLIAAVSAALSTYSSSRAPS